jgi:hypothetical protein
MKKINKKIKEVALFILAISVLLVLSIATTFLNIAMYLAFIFRKNKMHDAVYHIHRNLKLDLNAIAKKYLNK